MQKKSNIILTLITRLQRWMDSVPGQTFLNYAYSWGASIVILGALFKLTHLPGGNLMLFIGMGTEVIVFFLAAFDRPFDKNEIDKELAKHYVTDAELAGQIPEGAEVAQGNARYMPGQPVIIGRGETDGVGEADAPPVQEGGSVAAALHGNSGGGVVVIGGGVAASPAAQVTEAVAAAAEAGVAAANARETDGHPAAQPLSIPHDADAEQLAAIIRAANDELLHRAQAVLSPEMEEATKVYIEKLRTLTETFAKVDEQSARLTRDSEEMENLNRTLTGINKVYELHLKSISLQVGTIDEINNQTHKLSEQIQHLNQVYGRMIEALTVNFARNAATAPSAAPAADEQQQ
ncbi:MAG: gliding motility protein GldL [Alloprevotella sp.]|nr:gliding motility protein GldL [Alloprevotella sp.]